MKRRSLFGALAAVLAAPFLPAPVRPPNPFTAFYDSPESLRFRAMPVNAEAIRAYQTQIIRRASQRAAARYLLG